MEKLIVYGSLHCPDTQAALKKLTESKIEYAFKNISSICNINNSIYEN